MFLEQDGGFEVVGVARDGGETIDIALEEDVDVVLMDLGLPGADGFETTRRLLGIKRAAKVIALTGRAEDEVREQMAEAGMVAYLSKDKVLDKILDTIRAV
jgi:DNA-binding NarL/FixJ family response regulator